MYLNITQKPWILAANLVIVGAAILDRLVPMIKEAYVKLPGDKLEPPDQVLISGTEQQIEECFQAWDQKRRNIGCRNHVRASQSMPEPARVDDNLK